MGFCGSNELVKVGNLQPLPIGASAEAAAKTAQQSVEEGIAAGQFDPGVVDFARSIVGEGREAALLIPLHAKFSRHTVLEGIKLGEPLEEVVGVPTHGKIDDYTWHLQKDSPTGNKFVYRQGQGGGKLGADSPFIVAATREDLQAAIEWRESQAEKLRALEKSTPLGTSTSLVEAAYGGIDITNPERAVTELGSRLLVSAVIDRQHSSDLSLSMDSEVLHKTYQILFKHVTGPYHQAYREYLNTINGAASMMTVDGSIDSERVNQLMGMVNADSTRFLEKVWPDLERVVAIERLGHRDILRLTKLFN